MEESQKFDYNNDHETFLHAYLYGGNFFKNELVLHFREVGSMIQNHDRWLSR